MFHDGDEKFVCLICVGGLYCESVGKGGGNVLT